MIVLFLHAQFTCTKVIEKYSKKRHIFKQLYALLYITDKIFIENNVTYWMEAGTLLGAIRHGGIIPWDDDADIGVFNDDVEKIEKLTDEFKKYNILMTNTFFGYKLFFIHAKKNHKFNYPSLDIFVFHKKKNQRLKYKNFRAEFVFGKCSLYTDDILPLKRYKFSNFYLNGVNENHSKLYCNDCYGKDWNTHYYEEYDHENEKIKEKIKKPLESNDRLPVKSIDIENDLINIINGNLDVMD
jgi:lipopolysaccharide cholinephosphotransferase